MNRNTVELIDFLGGDKLHSESFNFEKFNNWGDKKYISSNVLKYLVKEGKHFYFDSSKLCFNLTIDPLTFFDLIKLKPLKYSISKKEELTHILPRECHDQIIKDNIILDSGLEFSKKGDNMFNIMMDYIELSHKLRDRFKTDMEMYFNVQRSNEVSNLFLTNFEQLNINLYLSFLDFADLIRLGANVEIRFEVREILNDILDLIKNIEKNPFKYSLEAFKIDYI